MNDNLLEKLFDHSQFFQKEIFLKYKNPWEIIANLNKYVEEILGNEQILIGEGSSIDPSVKIEGRVIIGKNSTVSDSVLIREGVIIGDNVRIGHAVELKHSIIMNNSSVAHLNYIGDSIIGNNVNIGGGAIVANWRLDKKNIKIKLDNGEIDTNLEKFGACIGDNSSLGANSVLNPGTILSKKTLVFPLVSVVGVYSENSVIRG